MSPRPVISLSAELLAAVDAAAKAAELSRAALVRLALVAYLGEAAPPSEWAKAVRVHPSAPEEEPVEDLAPAPNFSGHKGHRKIQKTNFIWCDDCKEAL